MQNFDCSLSQPETVKLTENGKKFTISSKFYWQEKQQKCNKNDLLKNQIIFNASNNYCQLMLKFFGVVTVHM